MPRLAEKEMLFPLMALFTNSPPLRMMLLAEKLSGAGPRLVSNPTESCPLLMTVPPV